ncbi:hypothetical protein JTE90_013414 [Oedothorax gibbosus]|uniref:Uncharacterized protein n=1 Tax=Oedothorax gibbosus TaxID=931172 RepID=A0AAV6TIY9_9ARAC|nr:hypothetical protein JTE90_013414 [Oedothorax gibbosus]
MVNMSPDLAILPNEEQTFGLFETLTKKFMFPPCCESASKSSPLVSRAVFLNYLQSRQFHPGCNFIAEQPPSSHEIFRPLYRHLGVGVITRQRASVYHGWCFQSCQHTEFAWKDSIQHLFR